MRCSRCGKELNFYDMQENLVIHTRLGYGSDFDGEEVHYQLCCDCFDELIRGSAISPIVSESGGIDIDNA